MGSSQQIEEKEQLLEIYERKTIAERMSVNLKEELLVNEEKAPQKTEKQAQ